MRQVVSGHPVFSCKINALSLCLQARFALSRNMVDIAFSTFFERLFSD